ncbi:phosphoethanolamine N-methyltransferase [Daphnia magna]|uniref:Uncharacterized protein n=2 Tax=Daphnia magna TaxID=35525 RepID=A0ABR0AXW2_9CRUS|nr:phosphoethanolamine N-methyltransferase [Daphnia magna]KAK4029973.1 hypothetical protein OUZ56_022929 [Daphnia magna]KZS09820.1 Uncharacterized protein APZ42_025850 [Daphnia magna]
MSSSDVRQAMLSFWEQYEPSIESMMLSQDANELDRMEKEEILSYLPPIKGRSVLELGSGIGRFTDHLAEHAKHLTTVDFMADYVEKNRQRNGHHAHVDFLRADVTELQLPADKKFDVIFSNWLLMYLSDDEIKVLTRNMLTWLKDGGYLFVRESCFHPSGNIKLGSNPTFYRSPNEYFSLLQKEIGSCVSDDGENHHHNVFELSRANSVSAYVKAKGNPNQLCFLLKKMPYSAQEYESFQAFLDENQYSRKSILRYEKIFGPTYISTGGQETTIEFCKKLNLKPGQKVLDVGCGIGGSAFHMAREYGAEVRGVDLSTNMITLALENQAKQEEEVKKKVCFEITDITKAIFPDESFDVIYSRDTLLHIGDKETLFANFFKWLRPGGKVLISDYCRGDQEHSEHFLRYVAQRGYHLLTVVDYGSIFTKVGFNEVEAKDVTDYFVEILQKETKSFAEQKEDFIKEFSPEDYNDILSGWQDKVKRCSEGDQAWGLFIAHK